MDGDSAIRLAAVSKTFRIPHEARTSVRDYFLHPLRRTTYETQQALKDVEFTVGTGEFFGIIGQNGSGKSTLLKILAGIYPADRGTVEVNGALSPFIELGAGFNMELNARDNIRLNGTLLGLSEREIVDRLDDILRFAELERFVDQKLKNYSSGMQVRLAFSIAIQVPFDVLLLDEVLAVGDKSFQEKCFATFEEIREAGKTIVLVTHALPDVRRFCDRALLLREGVVQKIGPPDQVIAVYAEQEEERLQARGAEAKTVEAEAESEWSLLSDVRQLTSSDVAAIPPKVIHRTLAEDQRRLRGQEVKLRHRAEEIARLRRRIRAMEAEWDDSDGSALGDVRNLSSADIAAMSPKVIHRALWEHQRKLREERQRLDDRAEEIARLTRAERALQATAEEAEQVARILIRRHYDDLPLPPDAILRRFSRRPTMISFLAQGLTAAESALGVYGEEPPEPVLEWGAAAGRTARWLRRYPRWHENYRGCDPDEEANEWATRNLGISLETTLLEPPLPYADGSFGGAFGFSLLHRIHPQLHRAWYEELRRIVRPGGPVYVGTAGPSLIPREMEVERDFAEHGYVYAMRDGAGGVAFVSEGFTRRCVKGLFEVAEYTPQGHGPVDTYLLTPVR